jgi:hypothetical protein
MSYNIYDFDQAYNDFVERFGIEPNGVVMHEATYQELKNCFNTNIVTESEVSPTTIFGKPIFRSMQIEINKIRFVI